MITKRAELLVKDASLIGTAFKALGNKIKGSNAYKSFTATPTGGALRDSAKGLRDNISEKVDGVKSWFAKKPAKPAEGAATGEGATKGWLAKKKDELSNWYNNTGFGKGVKDLAEAGKNIEGTNPILGYIMQHPLGSAAELGGAYLGGKWLFGDD